MVNSGCAVLSKGLDNPKLDTHTTADNINTVMNKDLFRNGEDYWLVAQNIKDLYLSEGSILTLMDFERVCWISLIYMLSRTGAVASWCRDQKWVDML